MLQYISGFIWNRHTVTVVTALINMFDAHFCSGHTLWSTTFLLQHQHKVKRTTYPWQQN